MQGRSSGIAGINFPVEVSSTSVNRMIDEFCGESENYLIHVIKPEVDEMCAQENADNEVIYIGWRVWMLQVGSRRWPVQRWQHDSLKKMLCIEDRAPDNLIFHTLGNYPLFLTVVGIKVGDVSNRG